MNLGMLAVVGGLLHRDVVLKVHLLKLRQIGVPFAEVLDAGDEGGDGLVHVGIDGGADVRDADSS